MQDKIIAGVCIVTIVTVGVIIGSVIHTENAKQKAATDKQIYSLQQQVKKVDATNEKLVTDYNNVVDQCNAGYAAYLLTTPAQRTANKLTAPACGLPIVQ